MEKGDSSRTNCEVMTIDLWNELFTNIYQISGKENKNAHWYVFSFLNISACGINYLVVHDIFNKFF